MIVVMGVSGSGKTTVAVRLAERLGVPFAEGDEFHPPANVEKMAAGVPLTDEDREPWLVLVADWMAGREVGVVTCSALKRRYRDILRKGAPHARFVHLHADRAVLAGRIGGRRGHFMPAVLLDSQLDALEPLGADEDGIAVDVSGSIDDIVTEIARRLQ